MISKKVAPPRAVVAVSGGVDSIVLLHKLVTRGDLQLIVAHFDHGIREDSADDREFVRQVATNYSVPFTTKSANLGAAASEDTARRARYAFLRDVQHQHEAHILMTAHHQDDYIETAILNMMRGSGRRGLTAMRHNSTIRRPLLDTPKQDLIDYAHKRHLQWREDPTNTSDVYLRNYVRSNIMPRFAPGTEARAAILQAINRLEQLNTAIDTEVRPLRLSIETNSQLDRSDFIMLPHGLAKEVVIDWLRSKDVISYDNPSIERLVIAAKTAKPGTMHQLPGNVTVRVGEDRLELKRS